MEVDICTYVGTNNRLFVPTVGTNNWIFVPMYVQITGYLYLCRYK